jgi:hypothetical protein
MSKFWKKFDDMMEELPRYIDEQVKVGMDFGKGFSKSVSTSTVIQDGNKIVIKTVNGKTTIKINGKEYVEKKAEKQAPERSFFRKRKDVASEPKNPSEGSYEAHNGK